MVYVSLTGMCSVTSCQCWQQIDAYMWSPLCEKMLIFRTYVERNVRTMKWRNNPNLTVLEFFKHTSNGIRSFKMGNWVAETREKWEKNKKG